MIGTHEIKLLLSNKQVPGLRKALANSSAKDIKSSKIELCKIIQLGEYLGRLIGPLLKVCLTLMKNVL